MQTLECHGNCTGGDSVTTPESYREAFGFVQINIFLTFSIVLISAELGH